MLKKLLKREIFVLKNFVLKISNMNGVGVRLIYMLVGVGVRNP